jgi:hypothetical protein
VRQTALLTLAWLALAAGICLPGSALADDGKPPPPGLDPADKEAELRQFEIEDSPFEELELACVEQGDAGACFEAGNAWSEGRGLDKPNITQAVNLWTAGCSFGHPEACLAAARQYLVGRVGVLLYGKELSLDFGEADRLLALACDDGLLEACGLRGDLLMAPKSMLPEGGPKLFHDLVDDMLLARQCFEIGCPPTPDPADLRSCSRLAQMYEVGQGGVRRDLPLATRFWDRACEVAVDGSTACAEARRVREQTPEPATDAPRVSVQPHRPAPTTHRFEDPTTGIEGQAKGDHFTRFDFELGVGARWTYGPDSVAGAKLRAGMNLWFNMIGIALETGFMTDKFAAVQYRTYTRFQHALGVKVAVQLPFSLPYRARMHVVAGAGGTLGSLKLHPAPYVFAYGIRQHIQLVLTTNQQRGPRQWGALRVEQQQTWHRDGGAAPEHSTQVVLVAGFTFGGKGADWTPKAHTGESAD